MENIKCFHKTVCTVCFSNKDKFISKQNETKLLQKIMEVFNLPVGGRNRKSCQFHAAPHHPIFSTLEGNIAEVSKILTSDN